MEEPSIRAIPWRSGATFAIFSKAADSLAFFDTLYSRKRIQAGAGIDHTPDK